MPRKELEDRFPSNPTAYIKSNHFKNVITEESKETDSNRNADQMQAMLTIRTGDLEEANGSAEAEWVRDFHGVKVYVLVGYDEERDKPVLITTWPAVHDPLMAVQSGRWSEKELREIHEFNDGNSLEEDFEYL